MIAVHLNNLKFQAFHGLYPGEEKTGGPFEVNLSVFYHPGGPIQSIEQTINYVDLFTIVQQEMKNRRPLIEMVAESICIAIKTQFPQITEIKLDIYKCAPPIFNFEGKTGITIHQTYS